MGSLTFLIILTFVLGLGAWLFFIWSVKTGHYDDIERPKHRMMDDSDDAPSAPGDRPLPKEEGKERRSPR